MSNRVEEGVVNSIIDTYAKFAYAIVEGSRSFRKLRAKADKAGKMSASLKAKEASSRKRAADPQDYKSMYGKPEANPQFRKDSKADNMNMDKMEQDHPSRLRASVYRSGRRAQARAAGEGYDDSTRAGNEAAEKEAKRQSRSQKERKGK